MSISDLVLDYTMSFASWWVIWELWTGDPLYAWRRQIKFMKNIKNNIQNRIKHKKDDTTGNTADIQRCFMSLLCTNLKKYIELMYISKREIM